MDNVKGFIIGGDYVSWQVFYDNRSQSGKYYAANDIEAKQQAELTIERLKLEYGGFPCYLYKDNSKWRIQIS